MTEFKNLLITYALKLLIWLLEKAIKSINSNKVSKSKKKKGADGYEEDIKINPDTAKMFSRFVKSHTLKKEETDEKDRM